MANLILFKEISIGGLTKNDLLQKLIKTGIQFNKYAHTLFEHPQFIPPEKAELVKIVITKLSDFNLENPCSFHQMLVRASSLGLKPCPLYLAAFLRLEYLEQAPGPYLTIASYKPENNEDFPNGFYIRNIEGSLWLRGYRADDFCEWPKENEFVFLMS